MSKSSNICRVAVPVANLRNKPEEAFVSVPGVTFGHSEKVACAPISESPNVTPGTGTRLKDPLQETQLLYCEKVRILSEEGPWCYVEALEQPVWDEATSSWIGYKGYVQTKMLCKNATHHEPNFLVRNKKTTLYSYLGEELGTLTLGTRLVIGGFTQSDYHIPITLHDGSYGYIVDLNAPTGPLELCMQLVSDPYLWGGLSAYDPTNPDCNTGYDCSGLSWLYHRFQGIDLPRNARDQIRCTTLCHGSELTQGDLIFMKSLKTQKVDHVMVYIGNNKLLEATMRSGNIRIIPTEERMGVPVASCASGHEHDNHLFYFGKPIRA